MTFCVWQKLRYWKWEELSHRNIIENKSSENKFCNIISRSQVSVNIVSHQILDGISKVAFEKEDFSQQLISIVIFYCSPSSNFLYVTQEFVPMKIYTILGDFNISALDYETFQLLKTIQNSDEIIVKKPTHLDGGGGLLDHVYIRKMFPRKKRVNAILWLVVFICETIYFIETYFVFVLSKTSQKYVF